MSRSKLARLVILYAIALAASRNNTVESNLDSAPGGRLTATNITVRELIRLAYGVKDYQIEHAPGWLEGERYDIVSAVNRFPVSCPPALRVPEPVPSL